MASVPDHFAGKPSQRQPQQHRQRRTDVGVGEGGNGNRRYYEALAFALGGLEDAYAPGHEAGPVRSVAGIDVL